MSSATFRYTGYMLLRFLLLLCFLVSLATPSLAEEVQRGESGFHPSVNALWICNSDDPRQVSETDQRVLDNFYPRPPEFFEQFNEGMCLGLSRTTGLLYEAGMLPTEVATQPTGDSPPTGLGYVADANNAYIDTRSELFELVVELQAGFQYDERINAFESGLLTALSFALGSHGREVNRFYSMADEVCQQIDAGHPWPVSVASPYEYVGHAVLAYAYERTNSEITLYIYDPNRFPSDYLDADSGEPIDPDYIRIAWDSLPEVHLNSGLGKYFVGQIITPIEPDAEYDPADPRLAELLAEQSQLQLK